ncbi:DUF3558 domain-containing protein [Amycolatopsis panacis]|uniref:DUF3558 domain-containing protein n=1 Tax=Amycolatopsis panacis TaxID=2340917 RepID=A0A419HPG2_9PSEU|nr:DUF3558 domain-containing protein [Amycolatopsis panacis]RJQ78271.1 DUF3558 domain-containing protein [Amycolatopsis panacis]
MRANWSRSRRAGTVAGLAFVAVASLVACSGGGSAGNSSSPSSSAPGGSSSSVDPSLKVPAPLQAQELLSNPCSALTDAQLKDIGLAPPGRVNPGPPDLCGWSAATIPENGVGVGAVPQNKGGISDIYAQKAKSAYFEPVTVNGYPGAFADMQDGRSSGSCSLWVGITDQLAFTVITSINIGQNKATPCRSAQKIAEAVVTHLKGAA